MFRPCVFNDVRRKTDDGDDVGSYMVLLLLSYVHMTSAGSVIALRALLANGVDDYDDVYKRATNETVAGTVFVTNSRVITNLSIFSL